MLGEIVLCVLIIVIGSFTAGFVETWYEHKKFKEEMKKRGYYGSEERN